MPECPICNKIISKYTIKRHIKLEKEYYKFPKKCLNCNKIINYEKRRHDFCSCICSNSNIDKLQKTKDVMMKKYNVNNAAKMPNSTKKVKATKKEKYGSENFVNVKKHQNTCMERYGVISYTKTKEYRKKYQNTCMKKYGVKHYSSTDEYKKKYRKTCMERYGVPNAILLNNFTSKPEIEIQQFLNKKGLQFIPNCRKIIKSPLTGCWMELDIFFPFSNKAIEFNGTYWHSFEHAKRNDIIKYNECKKMGIELMIINEQDWIDNKKECLSKILIFI